MRQYPVSGACIENGWSSELGKFGGAFFETDGNGNVCFSIEESVFSFSRISCYRCGWRSRLQFLSKNEHFVREIRHGR